MPHPEVTKETPQGHLAARTGVWTRTPLSRREAVSQALPHPSGNGVGEVRRLRHGSLQLEINIPQPEGSIGGRKRRPVFLSVRLFDTAGSRIPGTGNVGTLVAEWCVIGVASIVLLLLLCCFSGFRLRPTRQPVKGDGGAGPVLGARKVASLRSLRVEDYVGDLAARPLVGEECFELAGGAADVETGETDCDKRGIPAPLVRIEVRSGFGPTPRVVLAQDPSSPPRQFRELLEGPLRIKLLDDFAPPSFTSQTLQNPSPVKSVWPANSLPLVAVFR